MEKRSREQTSKKMLNFAILNMSEESNKGDLAIIESTIFLIRRCSPKAEISVLNCDFDTKEIEADDRFKHLKKLYVDHFGSFFPKIYAGKKSLISLLIGIKNFIVSLWILAVTFSFREKAYFLIPKKHKKAFSSIASANLIIIKGGSCFYSYGGSKQLLFLYRMMFSSLLSIFLNKKVIALGHSIGPFIGDASKKLAKFCLSRLDKIVVRESISYNFVTQELGINKNKVELVPDLAFWYPDHNSICNKKKILDIFKNEGINLNELNKIKVGLTVRKWNFPLSQDPEKLFKNYIDALIKILDKLYFEYGAKIFIMPHCPDDIEIGEQIAKKSKNPSVFVLKGDYPTKELRALYGMMDIFVGTRIHSDIFALSAGVPVIAIAYQIHKGFGIISMVEDDCIVDIAKVSDEVLWRMIRKVLNEKAERRRKISAKVDYLKREVEDRVSFIIHSYIDEV